MGTDPRDMVGAKRAGSGSRSGERGFGLIDLVVAAAISAAFVLATAAAFGMRAPRTHPAALALQAALVEAKSLAEATADDTDKAYPTGATVLVAPDPAHPGGSAISVYRSRPIVNAVPGGPESPLRPDAGFPALHVGATFAVGAGTSGTPFAILISSSGYASIVIPYVYGAAGSRAIARDPGCSDAGATIAVSDGFRTEAHAFACRDAGYEASG